MGSRTKSWAAVGLVIMLILFSAAFTVYAAEGPRRSHEGGGVTIDLVLLPVKDGASNIRFTVRMNTHSVPLDDYHMVKLSLLRDGRGRTFPASTWANPRGGGHHRSGVLVFPAKTPSGAPITKEQSGFIEVVIKNVAGIPERVFRWDLPIKTASH